MGKIDLYIDIFVSYDVILWLLFVANSKVRIMSMRSYEFYLV